MDFKAVWKRLPKPIQTALVVAEGGAVGALGQVLADPKSLCFTLGCLKQYAIVAFTGAVIAVRLWMRQAPQKENPAEPVDPQA